MSIFECVTGGLIYEEANRLASAAVAQYGDLAALISKFEEHGLGDAAESWVSNGPNKPVSAQQLREVLGTDPLAKRFGLKAEDYAESLTHLLPSLINRLTSDGVLAKSDSSPARREAQLASGHKCQRSRSK